MAKTPSPIARAVMHLVRFRGPKKVDTPIANFSIAAAAKTGARTAGTWALYTISAPTTKISTPQCWTKNCEPGGQSTPKANHKNRRGKKSAAKPAPAVITPEATRIHPMDDANILSVPRKTGCTHLKGWRSLGCQTTGKTDRKPEWE